MNYYHNRPMSIIESDLKKIAEDMEKIVENKIKEKNNNVKKDDVEEYIFYNNKKVSKYINQIKQMGYEIVIPSDFYLILTNYGYCPF